jgi:hypothetical protein
MFVARLLSVAAAALSTVSIHYYKVGKCMCKIAINIYAN